MNMVILYKLNLTLLCLTLLFSLSAEGHIYRESTVDGDNNFFQKASDPLHKSLAYTDTLTILFIGNSFTQQNYTMDCIKKLVVSGIPELYYDWSLQMYPGRTLEQHWELGTHHYVKRTSLTIPEQEDLLVRLNAMIESDPDNQPFKNARSRHIQLLNDLKNNVKFKNWDIVVLQSWKDDTEGSSSKYIEWARKYAELIVAQGGEVVLYETSPGIGSNTIPGRLNQFALTAAPTPAQIEVVAQKARMIAGLADELHARVVPMSTIYLRCQTDRPDITLRYVNDNHPNQTGTYLGACTFYGVLFDRSPVGLPLDSVTSTQPKANNLDPDGGPLTKKFSDTDRLDLQRIAWDGIADFKQFTTGVKEVKGNMPVEIFPNPSNGLITLKFNDSEMFNKGFNIKLISMDGKVVYSKSYVNYEAGETTIDTSTIAGSLYILRIENTKDFIVSKFLVNSM
jgi:hypothetical protein